MRYLVSLCCLAGLALAADPREAQIIEREQAFDSAWNKRDVEKLTDLITDDFYQISRTNAAFSRTQFLEAMKAGQYSSAGADAQYIGPADLMIRFYGPNTAIVTYSKEGPWGART